MIEARVVSVTMKGGDRVASNEDNISFHPYPLLSKTHKIEEPCKSFYIAPC